MGFTLLIHGIPVEAANAKDAAALLREFEPQPHSAASLAAMKTAPIPPPPHSAKAVAEAAKPPAPVGQQVIEDAFKFLTALRESGDGGVNADQIAQMFALSDQRAIGSKSAGFNRLLMAIGLKPGTVYDNPRAADGKRTWVARKNIGEALTSIALMR